MRAEGRRRGPGTPALHTLLRYRVMAWVVGVCLIVLVFAGIPLQVEGHPGLVNVLGVVHGILYLVYLLAAWALSRRAHFRLGRLLAMAAAGFVPGLAFYVERRINRQIRSDVAGSVRSGLGEPKVAGPA